MSRCSFPFPEGANPVLSEPCHGCPNHLETKLDREAAVKALRSLGEWLWEGAIESRVAPIREEALRLYSSGAEECIPKALLRAHHAVQVIAPWECPSFSKTARYSFLGMTVPSWPNGDERRGVRWEMLDRATRG